MQAVATFVTAESVPVPKNEQLANWLASIASERNRNSFEALYGHFAPRIKSYMLKLGADDAMAEDLSQETMVQIWNKAGLYDAGKATPSSWIFRIARNLRIDRLRRVKYHEVDISSVAEGSLGVTHEDKKNVDQLDAARISHHVDSLPADQKIVVQLAFYDGMTHAEICQHLELPLGTVKSRLRLAFGKLRTAIGEES